MKAEITGSGDELTISLDASELPVIASDDSLRAKLPENAAGIADGVMAMISQPPQPGEPKAVRTVHVRMVRTVVVAETSLMLDSPSEVYP